VQNLWRFRRFLVRNGVHAKIGEELQILQTAILAVLFLNLLRILLRVAGPFALAGAAGQARRLVERMSYASRACWTACRVLVGPTLSAIG